MTKIQPPHPSPLPSGERDGVRGVSVIGYWATGIYLGFGIWCLEFQHLGPKFL